MKTISTLLILLLFDCQSLFGQVELSYTKYKSIVGLTGEPRLIGNRVLVGEDSKPSVADLTVVQVKTDGSIVKIRARKTLKEDVPLEKIADNEWAVLSNDSVVVEVFAKNANGDLFDASLDINIVPPTPGPQPPTPNPIDPIIDPVVPPTPAPIPVDGFRVLIVYESDQMSSIPPAQQAIFFSAEIRDWLNLNCVKKGSTAEWRITDEDVAVDESAKIWGDALKRPRQGLPWIIISDGKTGYEGLLPGNIADTLKLLKEYKK